MTKDIVYRVNAASAVVATSDGNVTEMVDEAQKETETLKIKIVTRAHREGWHNYEEGINSAPQFVRPEGEERPKAEEIMLMYFLQARPACPKWLPTTITTPWLIFRQLFTGIMWTLTDSILQSPKPVGESCLGQALWPMACRNCCLCI